MRASVCAGFQGLPVGIFCEYVEDQFEACVHEIPVRIVVAAAECQGLVVSPGAVLPIPVVDGVDRNLILVRAGELLPVGFTRVVLPTV